MWLKLKSQRKKFKRSGAALGLALLTLFSVASPVAALTPIPVPTPKANSFGLEATKTQPPPTQGATVTIPGSGASFSTSPTTVAGTCPTGLLVEVYDNGVMVGSVLCAGGSFTVQVTLFNGENDLTASVFDSLDQPGPASNTATVNYNNANFAAFGALVTLTSNYGRRAAQPGTALTWPILLSGGSGPYAFSIDWGDDSPADLKSQALAGEVDLSHVYNKSGVYHVTVKVTDANGITAFLQLVAIANGNGGSAAGSAAGGSTKPTNTATKVMVVPEAMALLMMAPIYLLGRRSQLRSLRHRLEKDAAKYAAQE